MSSQRDYSQPGDPWSGQSWARGFSPLFRGMPSDEHLRVSDADRQAVTDRLSQHFADGRLDQAEFDARVDRAMSATTRGDLNGLFTDLPEAGAPAVTDHPARRRHHPVLLLVLFVVLVSAAGHLLFWTAVPVFWLAFLVVAVLLFSRTAHRGRASHDRWL
jgi:Domain of unknown function (DUF1707)